MIKIKAHKKADRIFCRAYSFSCMTISLPRSLAIQTKGTERMGVPMG
jgi:hypothetical protein